MKKKSDLTGWTVLHWKLKTCPTAEEYHCRQSWTDWINNNVGDFQNSAVDQCRHSQTPSTVILCCTTDLPAATPSASNTDYPIKSGPSRSVRWWEGMVKIQKHDRSSQHKSSHVTRHGAKSLYHVALTMAFTRRYKCVQLRPHCEAQLEEPVLCSKYQPPPPKKNPKQGCYFSDWISMSMLSHLYYLIL